MQFWRVLLFGLMLAAAAPCSAFCQSPGVADPKRFDALLKLLQSDDFEEREDASREIIEVGAAIRPWIERGAQGTPLELRLRCEQLLRRIDNTAFERQVAAFRVGRDSSAEPNLPCWNEFKSLFGDDAKARELFCDVSLSERSLLLSVEDYHQAARAVDAKTADAERRARLTLKARPIQKLLEELATTQLVRSIHDDSESSSSSGRSKWHRVETLCVCILIGNDDKFQEHRAISNSVIGFIRDPVNLTAIRKSPYFPTLRVGLSRWLLKSEVKVQSLSIAMHLGLSEVALELGRKAVDSYTGDKSVDPDDAGQAMMMGATLGVIACGRFGDKSDLVRLAKLLDKQVVIQTWITVDQKTSTGQLRDLALAYSAHLAGINAKDLGFPHLETNSETVFLPYTVTFLDDAQRQAAHEEWKRRRGSKVKKPASGATPKSG